MISSRLVSAPAEILEVRKPLSRFPCSTFPSTISESPPRSLFDEENHVIWRAAVKKAHRRSVSAFGFLVASAKGQPTNPAIAALALVN